MHYNLPGSQQQGVAIQLPLMHSYYSTINYKGLLVIIEQNPPTHLIATMPQP